MGQAATGKSVDQIKAEVATATSTDAVTANSGALVNRFDAAQVEKELDTQVDVTQAFDQNRQEAKAELYVRAQAKADEARALRMANGGKDTDESRALDEEAVSLRKAGSYVDMAATAVFAGPELDDVLGGLVLTGTNRVYRAASPEAKVVLQKCEANGQNCTAIEVDRDDVVQGEDGRIHVFNNGIFNAEEYALATGAKQNTNEANRQGVYYILNPYTGNFLDELLYAGYDKANDLLGGKLPLTSAEKTNQAIIDDARRNGGVVDSVNHSRGGMTWIIALGDLERQRERNLPIGNALNNGAAANAQDAADLMLKLGDGRAKMWQSTHSSDFVGRWLGGNPATDLFENSGSFPSSHSAYTGYLPIEGVHIGGKPIREITDKTWGQGHYSVPVYVPPSEKARAKQAKGGG